MATKTYGYIVAYLHCWIWILILIPILTANQMAILYYVGLFTQQSQILIPIPTETYILRQEWDRNPDQSWNLDL